MGKAFEDFFIGPTTHQVTSVPRWSRMRRMAWGSSQLWETHDSTGWPCKVNLTKVLGQMVALMGSSTAVIVDATRE